jgi:predicted pyridoxine 5'-phosphate oxidase superfamily flavin-nucleotide-binding protein
MNASTFHNGELRAQALAGGGASGAGIRDRMPDQHRQFFPLLHAVFVSLPDEDGWPVASILTGTPGFVSSPDPATLRIAATLTKPDPAAGLVRAGRSMGVLGLDFATRRNRVNGVIVDADATGLTLAVEQSFGNCAKYIQTRQVRAAAAEPGHFEELSGLDVEAVSLIRSADTFFVATGFVATGFTTTGFTATGAGKGGAGGMDISHRGGRPGFVQVSGNELIVPDFPGNRYFNTFGNLVVEPRAGLLFIDFDTGDLLHLKGTTAIDWTPPDIAPAGTERVWRFTTSTMIRRRSAVPLRWDFAEFSPASLATGVW